MRPLPTAASARRTMIAAILALAAASVAYRLMVLSELQHTSLVFIGIPTILAMVTLFVQPRTAWGSVQKTVALALCLSGVVFGEGFICIVMAAPLFFFIAAIVVKLSPPAAPLGPDGTPLERGGTESRLALLLLLPMSLEGVLPRFELPREDVVAVTRELPASIDNVRGALGREMRFDHELPLFFRLGFPTPGATSGEGLAVGDHRTVQFLHGGHHPGTLVLRVTRSDADRVVFTAVSDDTYITHWLAWRDAEVRLRALGPTRTEVMWTLRYRRRLDPAWYFKPLERYGVRLAAEYLIATLATPK